METADIWKRVRAWAEAETDISPVTVRVWKARSRLPDGPALDLLANETYRRYGLRKADVLALAGRQT